MIKALLFDKAGTLIDFEKTWFKAIHNVLITLSNGDSAALARLESVCDYKDGKFSPDSMVIAGASADYSDILAQACGELGGAAFLKKYDDLALEEGLKATTPIGDVHSLLTKLKAKGYILGLATNGSYALAIGHSDRLNITPLFDFICGYDSGFGRKPKGGMVLGFCAHVNVTPEEVAVIGDTLHDAGAVAIGVASGLTPHETLAKEADVMIEKLEDLLTPHPYPLPQGERELI
jgi:phosphoglycolate phosphatase